MGAPGGKMISNSASTPTWSTNLPALTAVHLPLSMTTFAGVWDTADENIANIQPEDIPRI